MGGSEHEQRVVQEGDEERSPERPTQTMGPWEMRWMAISWGAYDWFPANP